jgi:hypothetical protein
MVRRKISSTWDEKWKTHISKSKKYRFLWLVLLHRKYIQDYVNDLIISPKKLILKHRLIRDYCFMKTKSAIGNCFHSDTYFVILKAQTKMEKLVEKQAVKSYV